MTIRRINHTGRIKIRREDVDIIVNDNGPRRSDFRATLNLTGYSLPDTANIFVEAYAPSVCQRFSFGEIGNFRAPERLVLSEFDSAASIKFRVKVIASSNGNKHILAEADQLSSNSGEDGDSVRPLLPVDRSNDLGDEVFRLDGLNENDSPVLLINASIADWKSVSTSRLFVALAFPSIIRQILTVVLLRDGHTDMDDTEDWRSLWLRFAHSFPSVSEIPDPSNELAVEDWIETAVRAFAQFHDLLSHFQTSWTGETK